MLRGSQVCSALRAALRLPWVWPSATAAQRSSAPPHSLLSAFGFGPFIYKIFAL